MTLTSNNDLLLSVCNSSDIKLLTKSGEIKPFFSVSSPLLPQGIHVTSDNNIIVGVKEPGDTLHTYRQKYKGTTYLWYGW